MVQRKTTSVQPIEPKQFSLDEINRGIAKLKRRLEEIKKLDPAKTQYDNPAVDTTESNIRASILEIFGENSQEYRDHGYHSIDYGPSHIGMSAAENQQNFAGWPRSIALLEGLVARLEEKRLDLETTEKLPTLAPSQTPIEQVKQLCLKFHAVARQILHRYKDRPTLEIKDEYDVQDLFHALLRIWFDDIRKEEWTPSYAGSSSRVDFLLKQERLVVEVKKARHGLGAKELGEELIVDIARYKVHPDCTRLLCLIYDPDSLIRNPKGLEIDLSKTHESLPVDVFIVPKSV